MQVPIVWENGKSVIFTMLVVPNLTWPILFGQNHLRQTDARIRCKDLKVYFADSALGFEVSCYDSNPLRSFPVLHSSKSPPDSSANITCLLTSMPAEHGAPAQVSLHPGFNLVTVYLVLATSLVGTSFFSGPLWLEGSYFSPGLQTLSGPITMETLQSSSDTAPFLFGTISNPPDNTPVSPPFSAHVYCSGALLWPSDTACLPSQITNTYFVTTLVIESTAGTAHLPHHLPLGIIRARHASDTSLYHQAADYTVKLLSSQWYANMNAHSCVLSGTPDTLANTQLSANSDVNASIQDSSLLSPFLETTESEHCNAFPPTSDTNLLLHSDAFFTQLVAALQLHSPKYAHKHFSAIKADLRRHQRELYDDKARDICIPDGKIVSLRKDHVSSSDGKAARFIRNFDGPFIVTGHPYERSDLLTLRNAATGQAFPRPVNIEKVVVISDQVPDDLLLPDTQEPPFVSQTHPPSAPNSDLARIAFAFGKYLESLPNKSAVSSQACKYVYEHYPEARDILSRHGKLRGLVKCYNFLQLEGGIQGGTYILSLNQQLFSNIDS